MIGKTRSSLTLDEILREVTELQILGYYLNIYNIPTLISSPFRKDSNPSFSIYLSTNNKVRYKDFGTGEGGSIYDLIGKLYNLEFTEVLEKIHKDFNSINQVGPTTIVKNSYYRNRQILKLNNTLNSVKRDWLNYDLAYWMNYGISKEWLEFGDIYPISHIIYNNYEGFDYAVPAEKYAYAYIEFKDNIITQKIYQPFSKKKKWINKHDHSVWDLWNKLPESGDILIITSSRKDALTIWANTGIPSTGLQAESVLPKKHIVEQLKERFKKIYVLYDNDFSSEKNYGRIYGEKIVKEFDLIQIEIPEIYKSKDPSDLYKNWGREIFISVFRRLIKLKG